MEAHTEAVTARDLYSGGGSIYEAVYEEEAALARADVAFDVYGKAEGAAEKAKESTNEVKYENYITKLAGFDSNGAPLEFEAVEVEVVEADPDNDVEAVYKTFIRVKNQGGGLLAPVKQTDSDGEVMLFNDDNDVATDPTPRYVLPDTIADDTAPATGSLMVYDADGMAVTGTGELRVDHDRR